MINNNDVINNMMAGPSSAILNVEISPSVRRSVAPAVIQRATDILKKNEHMYESFPGRHYNLSITDVYRIANQRAMSGGRNFTELVEDMYNMYAGPGPDWIKEHREFRVKLMLDNIAKMSSNIQQYMYHLTNLLRLLHSKDFYRSFQAVYYADRGGYVQI